ncbi:polyprenyl diphosphate synthase [Streptomyces sp. NPDC057743]|uniref:polyprenyl diphosphate synthase n=1 Tax=Streptomyces sp. NPDC057743 TaxID=3346236 RepID=UPI0036AB6F86
MVTAAPVRHVAVIMDGNGRWAQHRGLDRPHGYIAARTAVEEVVDGALEAGVEWLTLFAFSTENWSRPEEEVSFLMRFLAQHAVDQQSRPLHDRGVRLRLLGSDDPRIPVEVMARLRAVEETTRRNDTLQLVLAFNYGGRQDICEGARSLVTEQAPAQSITTDTVTRHLQMPELPDVDLLVRTGGEYRLSNFLLWHSAYAEFVFLDVLWPDFRATHFRHALELYSQRRRRFGAVDPVDAADPTGPAEAAGPAAAGSPARPPGLPPLPALPRPTALLGLPTAVASHLGSKLWDGLRETAHFALDRLIADATKADPPDRLI